MKKRLAIIGTVGVPACYGGFETLAEQLVHRLSGEYEITIYCSGRKYPRSQRRSTYYGARLVYLPLSANGVSSILYDSLSILHALFYADVLLVLGVPGGILFPFIRYLTHRKLVVSIDGVEWKRNKWNRAAKWYLWWAEKIAVKYSHADIADNEAIQDYTAYRYKTLSHIIEYGADHAQPIAVSQQDLARYPFLESPYAFGVCRIEPENNIDLILEAFSKKTILPLVMVGNWNNSAYGRKLRTQYEGYPCLRLLDAIYESRELDLLRSNCNLYIHGHSAGGTNPSLVEAMWLGRPIAAFRVSYNLTTTEGKAWYFGTVSELYEILTQYDSHRLSENARAMKSIAARRYTWEVIIARYRSLIERVLVTKDKINVASDSSRLQIQELLDLDLAHLANPELFYEKR